MTTATPEPLLAPELETERPLLTNSPYVAPQVNLLPPEVAARKALRKLQAALAAGVIACGAVVGGLYVMANNGKASAQANLDQAVSEASTLQAAKSRLLPAQIARTQVQATKQALVSAMSAEVLWSRYLDQIRLRLPAGVRLTSLTVTPTTPGASGSSTGTSTTPAPAPSPAPAAGSTAGSAASAIAPLPTSGTIASVVIAGKAVDHDGVANWLDATAAIPGWTNVYLTNTTADSTGLVAFTMTANISSAALSHRFTAGS
jgi:Tfp pilus assembly protein PilN